jgi:hypothetical protein
VPQRIRHELDRPQDRPRDARLLEHRLAGSVQRAATDTPISTPSDETMTMCRTPAAFAPSIAADSCAGTFGPVASRESFVAPSSARATEPGSSKSPRAISTLPRPKCSSARAGSHASTRTSAPFASSIRTRVIPMFPVAPVTRIMPHPFRRCRRDGRREVSTAYRKKA